ncbi:MAG TPA: trypsin-like serine protease [Gemmatimonadaceae bacterium]|nr:trypsin-like serine protease [Gemmatimonadaceae bacterium]
MRIRFLVAGALSIGTAAIIRRGDRDDARYLAEGAKYPQVIALGRTGDATLIAPQWLLTAGHVANAVGSGRIGSDVVIGRGRYMIDRVVVHPQWRELGPHDVGLVHLARPVSSVTPLGLHRVRTERGQRAILVGHGGAGRGDLRERTEDGRARAATSRVDSTSDAWLYFSFDQPPAGTELEGAPGPGDSGGPAILTETGRRTVAGISSAGFDGKAGPGSYGAVDVFTRVSTYARWIDSVMHAAPPATRAPEPARSAAEGIALPDTPVGKRYTAFLAAMHAATDSAILSFLEKNFDERELAARPAQARLPNFRRLAERLRDAKVESIVSSDPLKLTAKLVGSAGTTTIELLCGADAPNKIVDWRRYD